MKFLLVTVLLVLTISTVIQCFESLDCFENSDCPLAPHQSCVHGQCRVIRQPMVRGSRSQDGSSRRAGCFEDSDCPSPQQCFNGMCAQSSRNIHNPEVHVCLGDWMCPSHLCVLGVCVAFG